MGFPANCKDFPQNASVGDIHQIWVNEYIFNGEEWVVNGGAEVHRFNQFESYISPTSGKLINNNRERSSDMAATGCVDARDLKGLPSEKMNNRGVKNG